ncbi:helix-turn-helix domain-containing protein [Cellulosilyticum sp. ST5]|uniref:Helix-turn-helix domain protein n=1 Tax=Cellulosilyticum lentocellum (strain ATCC 49066 / DSM 5427 / NCIMB 11756 / RHM5) TaxID=642492 RepID=F2JPP3_CELLD|nr:MULTISPECIES: helix-turn-helix domain-containing protein [Cellulosilyticum]ADZ83703.1 helix-turn-helix domain protein [Cellulosilyticum lentocellum DSM 5427]QEH69084.1 helix-turn-helix domain-containing protein [Cellulosilyticum sp. WCF-2]
MDCEKVGELIRSLRIECGLTQKQLADAMNISDKTVSKWERGLGCPDISLLPELSILLKVNIEKILSGDLNPNELLGGNMRMTQFYVCSECGNIMTSTGNAELSCCGRKLEALVPEKANETHVLQLETIEDEWYIETSHEMTKAHYISFIAFVTGEKMYLVKQYPEWGIHLRLPKMGHGKLYHYCNQHGLFYQII